MSKRKRSWDHKRKTKKQKVSHEQDPDYEVDEDLSYLDYEDDQDLSSLGTLLVEIIKENPGRSCTQITEIVQQKAKAGKWKGGKSAATIQRQLRRILRSKHVHRSQKKWPPNSNARYGRPRYAYAYYPSPVEDSQMTTTDIIREIVVRNPGITAGGVKEIAERSEVQNPDIGKFSLEAISHNLRNLLIQKTVRRKGRGCTGNPYRYYINDVFSQESSSESSSDDDDDDSSSSEEEDAVIEYSKYYESVEVEEEIVTSLEKLLLGIVDENPGISSKEITEIIAEKVNAGEWFGGGKIHTIRLELTKLVQGDRVQRHKEKCQDGNWEYVYYSRGYKYVKEVKEVVQNVADYEDHIRTTAKLILEIVEKNPGITSGGVRDELLIKVEYGEVKFEDISPKFAENDDEKSKSKKRRKISRRRMIFRTVSSVLLIMVNNKTLTTSGRGGISDPYRYTIGDWGEMHSRDDNLTVADSHDDDNSTVESEIVDTEYGSDDEDEIEIIVIEDDDPEPDVLTTTTTEEPVPLKEIEDDEAPIQIVQTGDDGATPRVVRNLGPLDNYPLIHTPDTLPKLRGSEKRDKPRRKDDRIILANFPLVYTPDNLPKLKGIENRDKSRKFPV